jgi:glucose/arabinose dehydrogenase
LLRFFLRSALAGSLLVFLSLAPAQQENENNEVDFDPQTIDYELVVDGLTAPLHIAYPPDDTDRLFIVDMVGIIYILENDELLEEPFLDIQDRIVELREDFDERGLLGMVFHPDYAENGRFFVNYSAPLRDGAPEDWNHTTHISEFRVSEDDENRADPDSERVVLQIDQPQFNHNAGDLIFMPDGYLWIPMGDGGDADDTGLGHPPLGNGQDVTTILGNILRIDVDAEEDVDARDLEEGERAYGIPEDNYFVEDPVDELPDEYEWEGEEPREEIWSWGWRNPYRVSYDEETDTLFVADAGQNMFEGIYVANEPGNYGWNIKEGTYWFDPEAAWEPLEEGPEEGPLGEPLKNPVIEYINTRTGPAPIDPPDEDAPHEEHHEIEEPVGTVTIGGHMYRGEAIPELEGMFVFGDWSRHWGVATGIVLVAEPQDFEPAEDREDLWPWMEVFELDGYLLSIERDAEGELYLLVNGEMAPIGETGRVYRIVPANDVEEPEEPEDENEEDDENND